MSGSQASAITLTEASSINLQVRTVFKVGLKGSNKLYANPDPNVDFDSLDLPTMTTIVDSSDNDQWKLRYRNAFAASKKVGECISSGAYSTAGVALHKIQQDTPKELAGNCAEMAIYAAMLASRNSGAQGAIYVARMKAPGDHIFCVIAKQPKPPQKPLTNLFSLDRYKDWIVIDPWLNICCFGPNYLNALNAQLQRWAGKGKRILWKEAWHNPLGSYKDALSNSEVSFKIYN
jgi:hypothetical protein